VRAEGSADRFRRDGFALIEGFVAHDELSRFREAVDAALAKPLPSGCERPHNTLAPLRWNDRVVDWALSSRRRRAALAEAVGAEDLRWISAYVSVKQPLSAPLWWHQDWWCWSQPVTYRQATSQIAVLCYLTDTSARTAALRLLPGTHHRSVPLHAALPEAHADEAGEVDPGHPAMSDHPGQVTVEAGAGDAVVVDYRLLHGTHANASRRRRDCLVLTFTPSWSALPAAIRAHLIRHPALPTPEERASLAEPSELLPHYAGPARDLPLDRVAPPDFATAPA
jgi:ectoine hydroxylase-related dioxygenase (phytanoyl-CoA dioxygenase family)